MLPQLKERLVGHVVLDHAYGIVIPSTVNVDQVADTSLISAVCDIAESRLSTWFGGFTAYRLCDGGWMSGLGVVKEPVTVYVAQCDEQSMLARFDDMLALSQAICAKMSQEAVSLLVDGALVLVTVPEVVPAIETVAEIA